MFEIKSNLEATFQSWSQPSSDSESSKCENAINMIKSALRTSEELSNYDIQLIPKGSYHNNTNVRLNSDVDIAVKLKDIFFAEYPDGKKHEDFGNYSAKYTFQEYRAAVEQAMINKFGYANVEFGNKSLKIHSNTYRVDADVVPCFEHRRYSSDGSYITGTEFIARHNGEHVRNFPEQHYENGVYKNNRTSRRYKKVVRIFKRLRYKLRDEGHKVDNISSFLLESLIWNVPNDKFNGTTLTSDVRECFVYLIENTLNVKSCEGWGEVSELLYLFHPSRKYTVDQVNIFLCEGYKYLFK